MKKSCLSLCSLFSIPLGKASLIEVVGDSLSETEAKNPVENQWRSRPPSYRTVVSLYSCTFTTAVKEVHNALQGPIR